MAGHGSFRSRTALAMAAGFLAVIALIGLAVAVFVHQLSRADAISHTIAVQAESWRILSLAQDAETGQRGYLLTGQAGYLEPYAVARNAITPAIGRLATLTNDNAAQAQRIAVLRDLMAAKLEELRAAIAARDDGGTAAAAEVVMRGHGKSLMDQIRSTIAAMQANEATLLADRQAAAARIAWVVWTVLATVMAMLLALGGRAVKEAAYRASLARFLPEELASRLASGDTAFSTGRRQAAAIAFVDIRGSTALAEGLDPTRLSVLLSSFRRRVLRVTRRHHGVVDKFIGDGALIVFGLPEPAPDDAARALRFATDLVAAIARWNAKRPAAAAISIGVGVHFGEVFCGIVGAESRLEFTVLGDTVNVASRLEAATKDHGVAILVSEPAWRAAGQPAEGWREVGREPLKGRREPMPYLAPVSTTG